MVDWVMVVGWEVVLAMGDGGGSRGRRGRCGRGRRGRCRGRRGRCHDRRGCRCRRGGSGGSGCGVSG